MEPYRTRLEATLAVLMRILTTGSKETIASPPKSIVPPSTYVSSIRLMRGSASTE